MADIACPIVYRARWLKHGIVQVVEKNFMEEACRNYDKFKEHHMAIFLLHPNYRDLYPSIEPILLSDLSKEEQKMVSDAWEKEWDRHPISPSLAMDGKKVLIHPGGNDDR